MSEPVELDDRFFRHEAGRLYAALTRVFGVENLALVEDVVQETLARAFEVWSFHGVPSHHAALLMTSAKNRAIDVLRRERTARRFAPDLARELESEWTLRPTVDELFLPEAFRDDELRMMFSCCQPHLPEDVQVALVLNVLSGFGASEIASAFLVSEAAMEKRLARGKKALAASKHLFDFGTRGGATEIAARLEAVERALYLLFNEGYHGSSPEAVVRRDLCREAMRLARLLVDHEATSTPSTRALAALMCFGAARLPARIDDAGNLTALFDQDRSKWDATLIAEGLALLDASATGEALSPYHVEAGIAALHAAARSAKETRWGEIVALYDVLMKIRPSPVVALSRAVALAEHEGPARGLEAIDAIEAHDRLAPYPFYAAARAELELRLGRRDEARAHFREAEELARNDAERRFLAQRVAACDAPGA